MQKLVSFHDFHRWPFQVSAIGPDPGTPTPFTTAHQWLLAQLGAVRTCFGAGVMTCHVSPFHTAAADRPRNPVAMQNVRDEQDTPVSLPPGGSSS